MGAFKTQAAVKQTLSPMRTISSMREGDHLAALKRHSSSDVR